MSQRCKNCVLPDTVPNIKFDKNGVCHYCATYEREGDILREDREAKQDRYNNLFDTLRRQRQEGMQNSEYDVLVPLSGGRDSSYVAYALSVKEKLRVLCVNYENPFSSEQAEKNIDRIVSGLGMDLIRFKWPGQRHEKSFKNNLQAWLKKPTLGSMPFICLACKPIYLKCFQIAHEKGINLIVDGSNPNEVTQFKMESQIGANSSKYKLSKAIPKMGKKFLSNYRYVKPCNIIPAIHTVMSLNGGTKYLKWNYPNIEKRGYFYVYPYNENEINAVLKQLGWEKAKDNNSPWRFDCEVDSIKNYLFSQLIHVTEKEDLFSKNIRAGLMTREEALSRLSEAEINEEILENVLKKIDMKLSDLRL